jgi:hypothetical protein
MSTFPPDGPDPRDEEYVARLRAADPAAHASLDLTALREAVAERARSEPADQLAVHRRRRAWVPVAAAAAAALVLGTGGGYAIGALHGGGSASSDALTSAPARLSQADGLAGPGETAVGSAPNSVPQPAMDGPMQAAGGADSSLMPRYGGYGRTVFSGRGLSGQTTSAHAWGLDGAAAATPATVQKLADALGLAGSVRTLADGSLIVGPQDGSGASLSLYPSGFGDVNYYDPAAETWACARAEKSAESGAGSTTPVAPDQCGERDLGPAPSVSDAEAQLTTILAAVGLDAADLSFESGAPGDSTHAYVTAYRLIDGKKSGLAWNASWTGGGLQSLYGSLAPLVDLGEYPVISPAQAVERLGDPRFGSGGGPLVYAGGAAAGGPAEVQPSPSRVQDAPAAVAPSAPEPGSKISWPVNQVTIVSTDLGLQVYVGASGASVVAPTYQLTAADGSTWSVIAVADSALDF